MSTTSHYDALGVPSWASAEEVQRAYRRQARLLHPDHLASQDLSAAQRARADVRMREVNEAWRVLGEPSRRAAYDATRTRGTSGSASGSGGVWTGPYPSPRPTAPRSRAPQGRVPSDEPVQQRRLGILLWVLFALAVAGIFVTTAYLGHPVTDPKAPTTTSLGQVCVRVRTGPSAVVVPCSGPNDGLVVDHVLDPSQCPVGSVGRRIVAGDPGVSCLRPAP